MQAKNLYLYLFLYIWALILLVVAILTFTTTDKDLCRYYEEKKLASNKVLEAYEVIKEYKEENDIPLSKEDKYQSGILGERYTSITTTLGIVEAKRTSINPNFAAVIIDMLKDADIKRGDEVGVIFSSSFPALNIAVLSVIDVFELKPCIMASVGSSSYGANDPNFIFFEMANLLYEKGVFKHKIDLMSLGGAKDIGMDFYDEDAKNNIISKITETNVDYLVEEDYERNIKYRVSYFNKKVPSMKMLINVGGSLVSMGKDEYAFIEENGLIKPGYYQRNEIKDLSKKGLIDTYLDKGINVIHLLNIKGLALEYGIPYDPATLPGVGSGNVYYETRYNITLPIITIILSLFMMIGYCIYRNKTKQQVK